MKFGRSLVVVAALIGACAASAGANTITPTFVGVTDLGNGTYRWDYNASLENGRLDADLVATDEFFTFYDIRGYVAGSASVASALPAGRWTASESLLGKTPVGQNPADGATGMNVSFTYTSNTTLAKSASFSLGTFSFVSTFSQWDPDGLWASQDLQRTGTPNVQWAVARIELPTPDGGSTLTLLGSALVAISMAARKLRKN
jgi:hypothetical protein